MALGGPFQQLSSSGTQKGEAAEAPAPDKALLELLQFCARELLYETALPSLPPHSCCYRRGSSGMGTVSQKEQVPCGMPPGPSPCSEGLPRLGVPQQPPHRAKLLPLSLTAPEEKPQLQTQWLRGKYGSLIYILQLSIQPATQHPVIAANFHVEITALFESVTVSVSHWILIQHLIHNCL